MDKLHFISFFHDQAILATYIPLPASKFASHFGNFNSYFFKIHHNFQNSQNFVKKFHNFLFVSKIFKTTKGPPLTSKGPPPPHYPITKFSFFLEFPKLGVYNIKHNLTISCFKFWLSKSALRLTNFRENNSHLQFFSRNFVTLK